MSQRKIKQLRKKLNIDIKKPADYRVMKKTKKIIYQTDALGNTKAVPVERTTLINASKYAYRKIKKMKNTRSVSDGQQVVKTA